MNNKIPLKKIKWYELIFVFLFSFVDVLFNAWICKTLYEIGIIPLFNNMGITLQTIAYPYFIVLIYILSYFRQLFTFNETYGLKNFDENESFAMNYFAQVCGNMAARGYTLLIAYLLTLILF